MGFPKNVTFRPPRLYGQPLSFSGQSGVANRAYFQPVTVFARQTFTTIVWRTGTNVSGNYDVGLYDAFLQAIFRKGATAMPVANSRVAVAMGNQTLAPGLYYLAIALSVSGINAQLRVEGYQQPVGNKILDAALPLPADASAAVIPPNGTGSTSWVAQNLLCLE